MHRHAKGHEAPCAPRVPPAPSACAGELPPLNRAKIILLCVAAAVAYGVLHDQITARLCIEYFTVAHPPIFPVASPALVALCWGVASTIGIGLVFGVLLTLVADSGGTPPLTASRLAGPVATLLGVTALAAFAAGWCGYFLAQSGAIAIPAGYADVVPAERHHAFMAVWFAHGASYLTGLSGGAILVLRVWRARGGAPVVPLFPRSPGGAIRAAVVVAVAAYILWIRFGK